MKDKIRQILREETSGFDEKTLKVLYQYMNFLTKDYVWYYDTPEQRFEWSPGSIWLINPKTEEWALELEKGGKLWWNWDFYYNFQRYFNMEESDYVKFITLLVEDVINRGVSSTELANFRWNPSVEDAINRGVSSTEAHPWPTIRSVDDVIDRGKELE
jgi:hypothetical protein